MNTVLAVTALIDSIKQDKRRVGYSVFTGIVFSAFIVLGFSIKKWEALPLSNPGFYLSFIGIAAVISLLVFLFLGIPQIKGNCKGASRKTKRIILFAGFGFMYLSWLVQLIGVYPGFFNYDAGQQWLMYAESAVTAHHPVLHTYLIGKCIHLSFILWGNALPGCFIYVCFQMLITAFSFACVLNFLLKRRIGVVFSIISIIYFSFAPTIVMCVLSVTKDSLFTPFLILFIIGTIEFVKLKEGEKLNVPKTALWYISAFFAAILRNNALYIIIPFMLFLIIRFRKKKQVFGLLGVLALLILYLGPFTKAVTVEGVKEREFLSVPAQQIMRVYHLHGEELAKEDIALIEETFERDALVVYIPKIADVAKGSIKPEFFDTHKKEVISLWLRLWRAYPKDYFESFLIENSGFWYPFTTLVLNADGGEGYYVCRSYQPVWSDPKIPAVYSYYKHFENANLVCNNPLTMWIFAPATYFYIFFLFTIFMLYKKKVESMPFVAVFLIWLTFLLGPVALVRYVGFLYALLPLEIGLIYSEIIKGK